MTARGKITRRLRGFPRDHAATSLLEFGLALPLLLGIGCYGIEFANFFVCQLRVSQYALNLADNASRVDKTRQLREFDINDVLTGTYLAGQNMGLTTNGRVTLSSIENVAQPWDNGVRYQRVHWQRCIGARGAGAKGEQGFNSALTPTVPINGGTDGTASTKGADAPSGYGAPTQVSAPVDGGAMYVEVNYEYQPIFGTLPLSGTLLKKRIIHYTASFVVRDDRDYTQLYNLSPSQSLMTCDKYSATPPAVKYS